MYQNFHTNFDTASIAGHSHGQTLCRNLLQPHVASWTQSYPLSFSLSFLCMTGKELPKGGENCNDGGHARGFLSTNKLVFSVPDP
jgi:hypothetical protein